MQKEFERKYFLIPGECNAQCELPIPLLVSRIIEIATAHADSLGIGYADMIPSNLGWVLSRLTIEMQRYPKVHEHYSIVTWIESWNRHFSLRCFEIKDGKGIVIGYARTVWMVIDIANHSNAGTLALKFDTTLISQKECPIARQSKHHAISVVPAASYTFRYTDIDFYRHVNTVRYVELLLNRFSLEDMDYYLPQRFEIAFMHESHFGETAYILRQREDEVEDMALDVDGQRVLSARFILKPRL